VQYDLSSVELDRYIERVRKLPKLSREEEHDVAVLAAAGDSRATKRLVEANLRYVVAIAIQYRRYGVSLGELIGEGNLGLMTAARKFDASRGTRFVTYAGYWIRAHVLEHVVRSVSMVGAGAGALRSKMYFKLRRERARAEMVSNDPTERLEHLAARFETTPERMAEMLARVERGDTSLDAETREGGRSMLDGLMSDDLSPDGAYQAAFEAQSLRDAVREALDTLDTRERYIVEQRILNVDDDEASLADLGRRLGVSRERARQLEARAKQKLEGKLRARMTV
jgi:RNA polymerase sigma-32 factor